jgi:hypothetical protein
MLRGQPCDSEDGRKTKIRHNSKSNEISQISRFFYINNIMEKLLFKKSKMADKLIMA